MAATLAILALLGLFAVLTIKWPGVAPGVAMTGYVLEQVAFSRSVFFALNDTFMNYAIGVLLIWALVVRHIKGLPTLKPLPAAAWPVFGLYALAALSSLWSIYPEHTTGVIFTTFIYFVVLCVFVFMSVATLGDLRQALFTMMILSFFLLLTLALFTRWGYRGPQYITGLTEDGRPKEGNPLAVAGLAGHAALVALLLNFRGIERPFQVLRWGIVLLGVAVILWTESRGQLFAALIAGVALMPLSRRISNLKGFLATGVGVGVLLYATSLIADTLVGGSERWSSDTMTSTYSATRLETAATVLDVWVNEGPVAWLLGIGYEASFDPNILGVYPHLVVAQTLGELGIVGFVLLLLVVIYAGMSVARMWPRVADHPQARGLVAALAAMFFFEVILSFKQGSLLTYNLAFAFAIILGRVETMLPHLQPGEVPQLMPEGYDEIEGDWAYDDYGPADYDPAAPEREPAYGVAM